MRSFSKKTYLEVFSALLVNLSSGWIGVLVIVPGFFGASGVSEYVGLLLKNLPFGIVSLVFALEFSERARSL